VSRHVFASIVALAALAGWLLGSWVWERDEPSRDAPDGMVYVPGGVTHIGADDGLPDERPVFRAEVAAFFMDVHPVTVAQFRRFVEATDYVTDAERLGDGAVYDARTGGWRLVAGADWRMPMGPDGAPAPDEHPVTQVSWNDALAYARWAGKRLPTEVEWEHAARNARDARSRYAWGDELVVAGRHRANTWQGPFPGGNTGADGHLVTSPVGFFGRTAIGLTDMGGNVWQWTADWFRPYDERGRPFAPDAGSEKVQRGGSFLCHPSWCHGYRVSARSHSTPDSALYHVGFRLVKDIEA
jgi:sulfatase modifying factor 1